MLRLIQILFITLQLFYIQQTYSQSVEFDNYHNCENDNKVKGRCKLVTECKEASSPKSSFKICCYHEKYKYELIEVVCCPDINKYLEPIRSNYSPGMTVSEQKCLDYNLERERRKLLNIELITPQCVYGKNVSQSASFAAGGFNAEIDEFPHMAAIGWELENQSRKKRSEEKNGSIGDPNLWVSEDFRGWEIFEDEKKTKYDWNCGGSLISKDYVLTAGHCLYDSGIGHVSSEPSVVRLGDVFSTIVKIASIITHPEYKPPKKYNDIGLLKLEESIEFSDIIRPACLYVNTELPINVTGTGWGEISSGGDKPERLQKVFLETFDNSTCQDYYPKSRILSEGIVESQFCAGSKFGGRDTCQGDSGGPLQIKSDRYKDTFEIVGIVSIGYECGSEYGGVYTRVSHYNDWIEKIVWPEDKDIYTLNI